MSLYDRITNETTERLPDTMIKSWDRDGVLVIPGAIPDHLINEYIKERADLIGGTDLWNPGWPNPTPYTKVESMRNLALQKTITNTGKLLIGNNPIGLHLCLTGFKSTERNWHSDSYLNPEGVRDRYIAVWIALDDVTEDSGPYQYIPGSHKWPVIERQKVLDEQQKRNERFDPVTWPSDTQEWVGEACDSEIKKRSASVASYLPKKGDILFWHAFLIHRGSKPTNPTAERRALICHYSGIHQRSDLPQTQKYSVPEKEVDGYYFKF